MTEQTDAAEARLSDEERGLMHDLAKRTGVDGVIQYVEVVIAAREAAARAEALREAADALGSGPTMRVLVERESCDWWTDRPVAAWLRDRAASIARTDGAGS